ncbi:MAG: metallophosphoesterase [Herbaspirillum sp.]
MTYNFIHISDVHFAPDAYDRRPAFRPFLEDLSKQVSQLEGETYLILSGDVAGEGSRKEDFASFFDQLDPILTKAGLPKSRRICVPGNHDISREVVRESFLEHESVIKMDLDEDAFNSYIKKHSSAFDEKFDGYLSFEESFAAYGVGSSLVGGAGHSISDDLGVFCANSAFFSSGGIDYRGDQISDFRRLAVGTRDLGNWLHQDTHKLRVFVCHHPPEWMVDWCRHELRTVFLSFDLCFFGHEHDHALVDEQRSTGRTLTLSAPALLTDKRLPMGYSITTIKVDGSKSVMYRQWDQRSQFVPGTVMAGTESGKVEFNQSRANVASNNCDVARRYFSNGLSRALLTFGRERGSHWVDPNIFDCPETERGRLSTKKYSVEDLISQPDSLMLAAPPQYGLSCVGWQICVTGLVNDSLWLRVDLSVTKQHSVRQELNFLLSTFGGNKDQVAGIVVDSWNVALNNANKCIEAIIREFPKSKIVVLASEFSPSLKTSGESIGGKTFRSLYLWALKRQALRGMVASYCEESDVDVDVEIVFNHVLHDLDALNLPRTALNCLTLLLVSDNESEPIVNRAEVIRRVLAIVFHSPASLTYRSRADLSDCEHLLGSFCESIVKGNNQLFTREDFVKSGKIFCAHMLVDVDVTGVLDLLVENSIIVKFGEQLGFRFSYWIYYFAAARMHHDSDFRNYIFTDMQYTRFPEVIEFYTGIDRGRTDAVVSLNEDLIKLQSSVGGKTNISSPSMLYSTFRWTARQLGEKKMLELLENDVLNSTLPQSVKDDFVDRSYDPARPYDQRIRSLLNSYSFDNLCAGLRASARALRNSDYVSSPV